MTIALRILATVSAVLVCACASPTEPVPIRIDWDTWGVPHITAATDADFFFADGWAQMHAHANTLLALYGRSRGRAAEYWGADPLASDVIVHRLAHPRQAADMWNRQAPETRAMLERFTAGINAYALAHADAIDDEMRRVLPVTPADVNLHTLFVTKLRFLAGGELRKARAWVQHGSNAIAIAPARATNGHALLLQNPHLPWQGEFMWFEKHLLGNDRNIYGVHLVGLPGFSIAFNTHQGWTHTVNTIDVADLYALELAEGGYLLDGEPRPFVESRVTLKVRTEDGSLEPRELVTQRSVHGPVIGTREDQAIALRMTGLATVDTHLQWWRMANAENFQAFDAALRMDQLPYFNVIYADRDGNIFFRSNGHVPVRPHGNWAYWQGIVPGGDSANLWQEIHGYDDMPSILNPTTGWLQNANDPPWTSTLPPALNADNFPPYLAPRGMELRPQRAARMVLADTSIDFEELTDIKHDTGLELAERLMDDLSDAVSAHGNAGAREGLAVLLNWDRRTDNDSRGAVLFQEWARGMSRSGGALFSQPWDSSRPVDTPDGLADPERAAAVLAQATEAVRTRHGRIDISWGEVNRIQHGATDLAANGAGGELGVIRVSSARPTGEAVQRVVGGDSWVAVIEFADTPRARVLLAYGNSSQAGSPHATDQYPLYSEQRLREPWLTSGQLQGHIERSEVLSAASPKH